MTTTGTAPSNSYLPLAYDGENYKIKPENVGYQQGDGQKLGVYTEASAGVGSWTPQITVGSLGSDTMARVACGFTVLQTFGSSYYYGAIEGMILRSHHTQYATMFVGTYRLVGDSTSAGGAAYFGAGGGTSAFNPNVNHNSQFILDGSDLKYSIWSSSGGTMWYSYLA